MEGKSEFMLFMEKWKRDSEKIEEHRRKEEEERKKESELREKKWKEEKEKWERDFEEKKRRMEVEDTLWKEKIEKLRKEREEMEAEKETSIMDKIVKVKNSLPHIMKRMPENIIDIPLYFEHMEHNFKIHNIDEQIWVHLIIPLMSSKVKKIFFGCGFPANEMFVYQIVKKQILKVLSYETPKYSLKSSYTHKIKPRFVKPIVAELVCNHFESVREIRCSDYIVIEPVIVKSGLNAFANVMVKNEPEVFETIEIVSSEAVCGDGCIDELNFIVDKISDEEANGCVSYIKDDAELVQIVKDDVAFVDVIEVIEEDCSVVLCEDVIGEISVVKVGQDIEMNDVSVVNDGSIVKKTESLESLFVVKDQVDSGGKWYQVFVIQVFDRGKLKLTGVNWIFMEILD